MVRTISVSAGYGDILFCEPIFRHFWKLDGIKPTVIIHPHQMWIQEYIESANFTSECPKEFVTGSLHHSDTMINLRYANQIYRGYEPHDHHDLESMMLDKYRLLGLSEDLWKTIDVKLIYDRAAKLCGIVGDSVGTGLSPTLICRYYHFHNSNSQAGKITLPFTNETTGRVCDMKEISGFSLIDWWMLIYHAAENHHVSTSTFFLMQAIKNKYPDWNNPCYIYPRPNEDGLRGISQLHPDFNLIRVGK